MSLGRHNHLAQGYKEAQRITRAHGTTYYWGTAFLPPQQRRDVYGLYALCRLADDIVDEPDSLVGYGIDRDAGSGRDPDRASVEGSAYGVELHESPERRLRQFQRLFETELARGGSDNPLLAAIVDTAVRLDLESDCYERFFTAMRLDLTRETWSTWEELRDVYMEGSAAVIGEMMLPVLRPLSYEKAFHPARTLGLAFQLTNFLRDVDEDLTRGRVYLPQDELAQYGADPWQRTVTPQWRAFMRAQIARNRELFIEAETGLPHLPAASRRCVGSALVMYSRILCRIEDADYNVFGVRHRVSTLAKVGVAGRVTLTGRARTAQPRRGSADQTRSADLGGVIDRTSHPSTHTKHAAPEHTSPDRTQTSPDRTQNITDRTPT